MQMLFLVSIIMVRYKLVTLAKNGDIGIQQSFFDWTYLS